MGSLKPSALFGLVAAAALFVPNAQAADILTAPPPVPAAPLVDVGGGFYLRGDVGVGSLRTGEYRQRELNQAGGLFLRRDIDDTFFVGVGAGYQFNSWLRADVTGEYRGATKFGGTDQYNFTCPFQAGSCGAVGQVLPRNNVWSGSLQSPVLLANAYGDLGTWSGITPFVGVGVGGAYNKVYGVTDYDPSDLGGGGFARNNAEWNFAWALHAGLGYAVSSTLKLELAYRYLNLGEVKSGNLGCLGNVPCSFGPLQVKEIDSHDVKLGMRWLLSEPVPVAHAPGPLTRKY